jgi:hypothetical protein
MGVGGDLVNYFFPLFFYFEILNLVVTCRHQLHRSYS